MADANLLPDPRRRSRHGCSGVDSACCNEINSDRTYSRARCRSRRRFSCRVFLSFILSSFAHIISRFILSMGLRGLATTGVAGAGPALGEAGAFSSLTASRRDALWEVWRRARERPGGLPLRDREPEVGFAALDAFETVTWGYRASGHSPRAHPLEGMRASLRRQDRGRHSMGGTRAPTTKQPRVANLLAAIS